MDTKHLVLLSDLPSKGYNMKGTVKDGVAVNIKPMDGSAQLGVLTGGQYVFADLNASATDLINFDHYYTELGVRVNLAKPCKVYIGSNILLTNETEGEPDPTPDPTPIPEINYDLHLQIRDGVLKSVTVDNEIWVKQI